MLPGAIKIATIDLVGPTGINPYAVAYGTTSDSHFDVTPHLKFDWGSSSGEFSLFTSARKNDSYIDFKFLKKNPHSGHY